MMSPSFHVNYKYLISTDGLNCAWSRVEWILFSNSLLLKDKSTKEQWFYPFLKDKENCVMFDPLRPESLLEIVEWLEANESEVLNMIEKANELANDYLTPEPIEEYTVAAINKYTDLLGESYFNYKYGNLDESDFANLKKASSIGQDHSNSITSVKNTFRILDLPIINDFLAKHLETINLILFRKDIMLYEKIYYYDQALIDIYELIKNSDLPLEDIINDG
jgi:hypothetical protein